MMAKNTYYSTRQDVFYALVDYTKRGSLSSPLITYTCCCTGMWLYVMFRCIPLAINTFSDGKYYIL